MRMASGQLPADCAARCVDALALIRPGPALVLSAAYFMLWAYSANALCASPPPTAWQPLKPIEYIVPAGAGAALDTAARVIKQTLESQKIVTQPIIMGPRGLSDEQIVYWERALSQLQRSADYMALLERNYWTPNFMARHEAVKYYDAQYEAWNRTLTDLGIAKD